MIPRYWVLIAAACVATSAAYSGFTRSTAPKTSVGAGAIHRRAVARAEVAATAGVARLRAQVDGRVLRVQAREGDRVTKGQLLATIETSTLTANVDRLHEEAQALRFSADSLSEGSRPEEREALRAEESGALASLTQAQDRAARASALRATGSISDAEMTQALHGVHAAEAAVAAAQARLRAAENGPRATDLQAARSHVSAAAAAELEARRTLEMSRIESPRDGLVLARRIEEGDVLTGSEAGGGLVLFEIADDANVELHAEVEAGDADLVAMGMEVTLRSPGGLAIVGQGTVTRVSGRLAARTIGVADARERAEGWTRAVWIAPRWTHGDFRHPLGERLEAVIELAASQSATVVPRGAVVVRDGSAYVDAAWGPWWREIPVELGLSDDQNVEIRGLEPGVVVRTGP